MVLKRGDIILVPFPFTDLTSTKVRPAVIISADPQVKDITVAFISSVAPKILSKFELSLPANDPDFDQTGLKKDSIFKLNKLLTISKILILRRLGSISSPLRSKIDATLKQALGLE